MNDQIRNALETIASRGPDPGATQVWREASQAAPKRRRRHRVRATIAGTAAVLVIAGVAVALRAGPSHSHRLVVATPTTVKSLAGTPLHPYTVLDRIVDGRPSIRQVATDTEGGVWFLYDALKHVDPAGSVTVTRLPKGFTVIADTVNPLFTVDPDGTAWLLGLTNFAEPTLGASLAEVTPGATSAKVIALGNLPDNGFGPNGFGGPHSPVALASDGAGHVALALSATSAIHIYDSGNGSFRDLLLPKNTEASSLRYFGNGHLAIGLATYNDGKPETTAVIASANGSLSRPIEVGDSSLVNPYSRTAVLFGGIRPTILDSDGTTHHVSLPARVFSYAQVGGAQLGHNGTIVVPGPMGITFLRSASDPVVTATYEYSTDDETCGPISGTGVAGASGASGASGGCLSPSRVAVAGNGTVWIFNGLRKRGADHFVIQRIDRY